ncbi:hypothetical protein ACWM1Q_17620, partial [Klebsiella grimontii]
FPVLFIYIDRRTPPSGNVDKRQERCHLIKLCTEMATEASKLRRRDEAKSPPSATGAPLAIKTPGALLF